MCWLFRWMWLIVSLKKWFFFTGNKTNACLGFSFCSKDSSLHWGRSCSNMPAQLILYLQFVEASVSGWVLASTSWVESLEWCSRVQSPREPLPLQEADSWPCWCHRHRKTLQDTDSPSSHHSCARSSSPGKRQINSLQIRGVILLWNDKQDFMVSVCKIKFTSGREEGLCNKIMIIKGSKPEERKIHNILCFSSHL